MHHPYYPSVPNIPSASTSKDNIPRYNPVISLPFPYPPPHPISHSSPQTNKTPAAPAKTPTKPIFLTPISAPPVLCTPTEVLVELALPPELVTSKLLTPDTLL
jgi:hypothetical protein